MPTPPAKSAGTTKSNIPIRSNPISEATEITSKLVEVPIVVHVPPKRLAKPMGIKSEDADLPVRIDTEIKMGRKRTTTGTLLMKALIKALRSKVTRKVAPGLIFQSLAIALPTGSSAPVRTIPRPAIMSAHTATKASWPNP
jgi:hypothetical protein